MSHAGCINLLDVLLLVASKLIDDGKVEGCPVVVQFHSVVLVALCGTGIELVVEDVVASEAQSPFSIMRRPLQLGIHAEDWTYVVNALYGLRLKEGTQDEAQILRATKFYGCRTAKYN